MTTRPRVFVSYVQENREVVALLIEELRRHAVDPWWDRDSLLPGTFWQDEIRRSIRSGQFFIACFSTEYLRRDRTYMNEELAIAIEEIRLRGDATWFIPVVLSGEVPDRSIGGGRTLRDIQFVELTAEHWGRGIASLCRALGAGSEIANTPTVPESVARERVQDDADSMGDLHRLTGIGQTATEMFSLQSGLWRVSLSHQGNGHFGVWLLDSEGERVDLLTSSSGSFRGTKLIRIPRAGTYLCDVSATGKWDISVSPPMQLDAISQLQGAAQAGTDLITVAGGLRVFRLTHDGRGHFGVWLLDSEGERVELLASTSGQFEGSKAVKLKSGAYALDITADGRWEIAWR